MTSRTYHVSLNELAEFKRAVQSDENSSLFDDGTVATLTNNTAWGRIELRCSYNAAEQELTIAIQKKPFVISTGTIFDHVEHLMEKEK